MVDPILKASEIQGWMALEELSWLYEAAKRMASIVELGCFKGRSTYVLCAGCPGQVYAVDCHWCGTMHPYEDGERYTFPEFKANVGHFANMTPFEGHFADAATSEVIPSVFDMVFFDGDHSKDSLLADLNLWEPRTLKLVCGHDYAEVTPGVEQALNDYFGKNAVSRGPHSLWYVDK